MKKRRIAAAVATVVVATAVGILLTRKKEHTVYLPLILSEPSPVYSVAGYAQGYFNTPYYGWSVGNISEPQNYIRMIWCISDEYHGQSLADHLAWATVVATADNTAGIHRTWLIMNEPDSPYGECGTETINGVSVYTVPRQAAHRYHDIYLTIKATDPNAAVFAAGVHQLGVPSTGQWWWTEFVDELKDQGWIDNLEGVHVHGYPRWSVYCADPFSDGWPQSGDWCMTGTLAIMDSWKEIYHDGLGLSDRPLWLTEVGCPSYADDLIPYGDAAWTYCRDNVMSRYKSWYSGGGYDAIFWFVGESIDKWRPTWLVGDNGLTPLGQYWQS